MVLISFYSTSRIVLADKGGTTSASGYDGEPGSGKPWKTFGNDNIDPYQNFLGTTDPVDLVIKTNNNEQMRVTSSGNVGIGTTSANHPLEMGSGAFVTSGGVWTNASSRDYKENIRDLTVNDAMEALDGLRPTRFSYKVDKEDEYVGFIAEEVPELVATKDRKGLSPMDITAVLITVVQEQQKMLKEQKKIISILLNKVNDIC